MIHPLLLSLLAVQEMPPAPPEPIRLPYYSCAAQARDPIGTVQAMQFVFPNGVRHDPVFSWEGQPDPQGIRLDAVWGAEGPSDNSFVQIAYAGLEPGNVYRIRVQRHSDNGADDLRLETSLRQPVNGALTVVAKWGPLAFGRSWRGWSPIIAASVRSSKAWIPSLERAVAPEQRGC